MKQQMQVCRQTLQACPIVLHLWQGKVANTCRPLEQRRQQQQQQQQTLLLQIPWPSNQRCMLLCWLILPPHQLPLKSLPRQLLAPVPHSVAAQQQQLHQLQRHPTVNSQQTVRPQHQTQAYLCLTQCETSL